VPNTARRARVRYALSNSFGFGGTNAALLMRQYEGDGSSGNNKPPGSG
jgi:3-oxoacyl-[acyl-carrier-protein] synthase II